LRRGMSAVLHALLMIDTPPQGRRRGLPHASSRRRKRVRGHARTRAGYARRVESKVTWR
jgi:hypothetical protein